MKRYKKLFNEIEGSITSTLEFYTQNGKVMVTYNGQDMPFLQFLDKKKYPASAPIIEFMYKKILKSFKNLPAIKSSIARHEPKEKIVLRFIIEYLSLKEDPIDIMIKNNGDIIFNLESN